MAANLIFLLATAALLAASYGGTVPAVQQRDYVNCKPQYGDRLLYQGAAHKPYKVLRKVSLDMYVSTRGARIHCITAVNSKPATPAAGVSVSRGGLGFANVTLHFVSQRGHGIHYNLTISGQ